jgi:hypothetical protein
MTTTKLSHSEGPSAELSNRPMVSEPKVMRTARHRRNNSTDSLNVKALSHRRSNSIGIVTHSLQNSSHGGPMSPLHETLNIQPSSAGLPEEKVSNETQDMVRSNSMFSWLGCKG